MNLHILASGLVFSLALAGCKTVTVKGHYNLAEHPGKGLVALSTRLDAGTCSNGIVTADLGFRKATMTDKGAAQPYAPVDSRILLPPEREPEADSIIFTMQTPRPERRVEPGYSETGIAEATTIAAEPPTRFVVQEVPAGFYILNSLEMVIPSYSGVYKATGILPGSFTVKEGEVVYLGEIGIKLKEGGCTFGALEFYKNFEFSVRDEWGRDGTQFKAEIRNISPDSVQKRLLQVQ
ncbi:MAG TPA: hypothetical protein VE057_19595 [Archangium sp.]|nr:hypothetical protein [Archangium sp.]